MRRAALELARLNEARTQALVAKPESAQSDLDQAMANLISRANVKIKEGRWKKGRPTWIIARSFHRYDGIVISRNVDVGQTVAASLQAGDFHDCQ